MSETVRQSILLVDADRSNQQSIQDALTGLAVDVVVAESAVDVALLVTRYDFALILFAVNPANLDPFEVAAALHRDEKTKFIPVIFQAESPEEADLLEQGYAAGGVDFLSKPITPAVFLAKVKIFLELDGRQRQLVLATAKIREQNLKLEERAIRDSLTGLYNHNYLLEQLAREVSRARRYDTPLSAFLLDLDFFKDINDTCGHPFGDFVLKEFSARVKGRLRSSDILGRYGGEEFVIILPSTDSTQADIVAESIREAIANVPFSNQRYSRYVTVSIGVYSEDSKKLVDSNVIVDNIDNALYQAKAEGRNRVVHYCLSSGDDQLHASVEMTQQSRLNATIEKSRAMTLASFEAMVHSLTREYDLLANRNRLFTEVLDLLCGQLNFPNSLVHSFRRAIKLHDLFRCYIHDPTLETGGELNQEQKEMLFDQPLMLRELTSMFDFFASERVILYSHHENYDGSGYPDGLKGHEIPMASRLFSLVDSFVAMVAPVAGIEKKSVDEAKEELRRNAGSQFDPFLVATLLQTLESENLVINENEKRDVEPK